MKRLTDPTFVYTPAVSTDIAKTFKRILAEQKKAAAQPSHVVPLKRKEAK